MGFSCAQVYKEANCRRIEFAIADAGCGMLHNVRKVLPQINDHAEAIRWCAQRGNTTAGGRDPWAQRLPEDAMFSPYPTGTDTFTEDDHHVGEGLWKLSELIQSVGGSLWIASGDAQYRHHNGETSTEPCRITWNGVAIEFEVRIAPGQGLAPRQQERLERLAERIGL
jgi:hypothetical protein